MSVPKGGHAFMFHNPTLLCRYAKGNMSGMGAWPSEEG